MEILSSAIITLLSFFGFLSATDMSASAISQVEPASVEIGLSEVSPLGELGGYAVPASGCSNPTEHNHGGMTCTPVTECSDGVDNADPEDTLIDMNDPGCVDPLDDDETDVSTGIGVTLVANPLSVPYGGDTVLSWYTAGSPSSCTASGDWSGSKSTAGGGELQSGLTIDQTYTITCSKWLGLMNESDTVTVSVGMPTQCSDGIDNTDSEDTLIDMDDPGCSDPLDDDEGNNSAPPGSGTTQCSDGVDNADTEDTLVDANDPGCHSDGDVSNSSSYDPTDNNEANAAAPSFIVELVSDPSAVAYGGSSNLTWTITGATPDTCTASGDWTGNKSTSGNTETLNNITTESTYIISCTLGSETRGDIAKVTVGIANPIITASPDVIRAGDPVAITWDPVGAYTDCQLSSNISNDAAFISGTWDANSANDLDPYFDYPTSQTTYRISCLGGTAEASVNVTVLPGIGET